MSERLAASGCRLILSPSVGPGLPSGYPDGPRPSPVDRREAQTGNGARYRGNRRPCGVGNGRLDLPNVRPYGRTKTGAVHRKEHRFREAANRQRGAAEATTRRPHGRRARCRPQWPPPSVVNRVGIRKGAASQVTATPKRWQVVGLDPMIGERIAPASSTTRGPPRSKRWCQRRCDQGRLEPGSRRPLRRAPFPEKGPRPRQR